MVVPHPRLLQDSTRWWLKLNWKLKRKPVERPDCNSGRGCLILVDLCARWESSIETPGKISLSRCLQLKGAGDGKLRFFSEQTAIGMEINKTTKHKSQDYDSSSLAD